MSRSDAEDWDSFPEFRCAREGFEVAATGGLLGGFDGRDRRELHVCRGMDPSRDRRLGLVQLPTAGCDSGSSMTWLTASPLIEP